MRGSMQSGALTTVCKSDPAAGELVTHPRGMGHRFLSVFLSTLTWPRGAHRSSLSAPLLMRARRATTDPGYFCDIKPDDSVVCELCLLADALTELLSDLSRAPRDRRFFQPANEDCDAA